MAERSRVFRAIRLAIGALRTLNPSRAAVIARDALGMCNIEPRGFETHLAGAMAWLCAAHDAGGGEGVSAGYSFIDGWLPPYPETTGYIIPTFFDYSQFSGVRDYAERALAMADWESRVQLASGGVQGGVYRGDKAARAESVFNTGQVILGWCRAFEESGIEQFRESAQKAGRWLCSVQSDDGTWGGHSPETATLLHSYDSRTAWSLFELSRITGEHTYAAAGERHLEWVLSVQSPNGWFANAEFFLPDHRWGRTFTHTISYVMEGLIEGWRLTQHHRYLHAATQTADSLAKVYAATGWLPGDFEPDWTSTARYSCLTGSAQIAGVLLRLAIVLDRPDFKRVGLALLGDVLRTHELRSWDVGVRGGVKGSDPIWGRYTPFVYPNWGVKFLVDTLLLAIRGER